MNPQQLPCNLLGEMNSLCAIRFDLLNKQEKTTENTIRETKTPTETYVGRRRTHRVVQPGELQTFIHTLAVPKITGRPTGNTSASEGGGLRMQIIMHIFANVVNLVNVVNVVNVINLVNTHNQI